MKDLKLTPRSHPWVGGRYGNLSDAFLFIFNVLSAVCKHWIPHNLQDVFDLPFHMARDQIEESLRTKMASIKVLFFVTVISLFQGSWF